MGNWSLGPQGNDLKEACGWCASFDDLQRYGLQRPLNALSVGDLSKSTLKTERLDIDLDRGAQLQGESSHS